MKGMGRQTKGAAYPMQKSLALRTRPQVAQLSSLPGTHTCRHGQTHSSTRAAARACMHMHACAHTTWWCGMPDCARARKCACVHVCMCACVCVCAFVCVGLCVCVCVCVRERECVHVFSALSVESFYRSLVIDLRSTTTTTTTSSSSSAAAPSPPLRPLLRPLLRPPFSSSSRFSCAASPLPPSSSAALLV